MDFLDTMLRRNPELIRGASELYDSGQIHHDTYVVDLDAVKHNATAIASAAKEAGVDTYFEAKQFGRNPPACRQVVNAGMTRAIAIDMEEAKSLHSSGIRVGHVGHLGQVPRSEAAYVLETLSPEVITVYNLDKAKQISDAAQKIGVEQKVLFKVKGANDISYSTLGGGIPERELLLAARRVASLPNLIFAGLTTYPAMRYNLRSRQVEPTPNFETIVRSAKTLRRAGFEVEQVNAAGMNTASTMKLLEELGGTHGEPGQALIGMTPLHAFSDDEPEIPGMVYVTEIDHVEGDRAFAYASGFVANVTIGVWNPLTYEYLYALVGDDTDELMKQRVILEPPVLPDSDPSFFMYVTLRRTRGTTLKVGQKVVIGCRGQVYRANSVKVAAVEGSRTGKPRVEGVYDRNGIRLTGDSDAAAATPVGTGKKLFQVPTRRAVRG